MFIISSLKRSSWSTSEGLNRFQFGSDLLEPSSQLLVEEKDPMNVSGCVALIRVEVCSPLAASVFVEEP